MLVSQILKSKPTAGVITIAPEATIAEAVALLSGRKIGAVIVSGDGQRAQGILSERDIVRALGQSGAACLNDSVGSLMTSRLVSCQRGDEAQEVLQKMTDGRFRHMPVIEGGELVGLISIGDVVKARLEELHAEKDALEGMIKGF
ncbi:CBS domain-containing protein [Neotabrizicola sp. VNH66]|uniref:CBS domain-containing protein n=1 Tax=Neotabrizicola sp. VNH66 TaxID=3400918 RepID=UPI003C0116F2